MAVQLGNTFLDNDNLWCLSRDDQVHEVKATLIYISGNTCMFMDTTDSSTYEVDTREAEPFLPFIEEDMKEKCVLTIYENKVVGIAPPMMVSRRVARVERAGRATARLQNGTEVEVDDEVKVGDVIDIDPSDGSFLGVSEE